jgi:LacI family gluconate utilization system Gnt-I transcriptional repressor
VITGCRHDDATRMLLRQARAPVAEMWELGGEPFDLQVGFSHRAVGETLAAHLYELGARRIAFAGARMSSDLRARQRCDGLRDWLARKGVDVFVVDLQSGASPTSGGEALGAALDGMPDVQAIACSNDVMALGVLFEAQRRGIDVPEQLAVTGFGDLPFSQVCVPPLTTIQPHAASIGLRIAKELLLQLDAPADDTAGAQEPRVVDVGFQLVTRQSSRTSHAVASGDA